MRLLVFSFSLAALLLSGSFFFKNGTVQFSLTRSASIIPTALAEDDDDEKYEDREKEDDGDDRKEYSSKSSGSSVRTETRTVIRYETRNIETQVEVIPEEYKKDTDGDGLVDGVDPNPLVPQQAYFTDDDDDGVPNALDHYPHEDDFAYYQEDLDMNANGIIDSYETVEER